MRKILLSLLLAVLAGPAFAVNSIAVNSGGSAPAGNSIQIKKAGVVEEKPEEEVTESVLGGNLIGTALNLWGGIQALKQQETALKRECKPSPSDIAFVNKMVQEYAKTGKESAAEMLKRLVKEPDCKTTYEDSVGIEGINVCYQKFSDKYGTADYGKIWSGYPMASVTENGKCPAKKPDCSENEKEFYTNAYEIYGTLDWEEKDLLGSELSHHSSLLAKAEKCDPAALKKKKQEMTGNLITSTLGSLGQKQNTATNMQSVMGVVTGSGGGSNPMGGLGALGTQLPGLMGGLGM